MILALLSAGIYFNTCERIYMSVQMKSMAHRNFIQKSHRHKSVNVRILRESVFSPGMSARPYLNRSESVRIILSHKLNWEQRSERNPDPKWHYILAVPSITSSDRIMREFQASSCQLHCVSTMALKAALLMLLLSIGAKFSFPSERTYLAFD